jgi:hypothetical protein
MTARQRALLGIRMMEIEAELQALVEGHVVDGDPTEVKASLLDEQESIKRRLGVAYFERRALG